MQRPASTRSPPGRAIERRSLGRPRTPCRKRQTPQNWQQRLHLLRDLPRECATNALNLLRRPGARQPVAWPLPFWIESARSSHPLAERAVIDLSRTGSVCSVGNAAELVRSAARIPRKSDSGALIIVRFFSSRWCSRIYVIFSPRAGPTIPSTPAPAGDRPTNGRSRTRTWDLFLIREAL